MGWNDHVEMVEMKCLSCGEIDTWWVWDDTGKARYTGGLGEKLGVDPTKGDKCPNCGSTRGVVYDEDSDDYWDELADAEAEGDNDDLDELTDEEAEAIEEEADPRGFYEKE